MTAIITNSQTVQIKDESAKQAATPAVGTVIEAEVIGEEKGRLNLKTDNGFVFTADAEEVSGEVADRLTFEVVSAEAGKISLKQILSQTQKEAPTEEKLADALKKISIKVTEESKNAVKTLLENNMEIQKESVKAVIRIKKTINYVVGNVTAEAIEELEKSGFSTEKLTLDVLSAVIKERTGKREELSDKDLSQLVDKYVKKEKISAEELSEKAEIIKTLHENELPVTEKNIALVEKTLEHYEDSKNLDADAIVSILQSGKEVNVENTFIAKHSSKPRTDKEKAKSKMPDELWNRLRPEIKKAMERAKIETTDENIETARFIVESDIPLTKENFDKYEILRDETARIAKDVVIEKAVENIKKERPTEDIKLDPKAYINEQQAAPERRKAINAKNQGLIEELPLIIEDEDVIRITTVWRGTKTVENFQKIYKKKQENPKEYQRELERLERQERTESEPVKDERKIEVVRAKRQLAEIQLRLTKEASARLAGKGIEIDTLPLEQALDELKQVEKDLYSRELAKVAAPVTEENVERMAEVFDKLRLSQPTSWRAYEAVIADKADFTINEVAAANTRAHEIFNDLETFATKPIEKFGDSLDRVLKEQVPQLLEKLDIEPSEENVRAAKILSRAQIDITAESLREVKIVDQKLDSIANRLHPTIAANMIKEGLNPVDMHVDEVNAYIDGYKDAYGDNLRDKISQYIVEMDDNKELPQSEREAMIAVYRLLNTAQKNENVAVGLALRSDTELTLGNLMEASRYYKRTSAKRGDVNVKVDDQFGTLQKLVKKNSIRQILNTNEALRTDTGRQSLENAEIEATKENIRAAVRLTEKNIQVSEDSLREEKVLMADERRTGSERRIRSTERTEQPERQGAERTERTERTEQPERQRAERTERTEQPERQMAERTERTERTERQTAERTERTERPERVNSERTERIEQPERQMAERTERTETPERQMAEKTEQPERSERANSERTERSERQTAERTERTEQPERQTAERTERTERPERQTAERTERTERSERQRAERTERTERPERQRTERTERTERPERQTAEQTERTEQPERTERVNSERTEQPERPTAGRTSSERPEQPERQRAERPDRTERPVSSSQPEAPERDIEENPFRPRTQEAAENSSASLPQQKAELISIAVDTFKALGLETEPTAALASAEKILAIANLVVNKENVKKAIETQTIVKRIATEATPEVLASLSQNGDKAEEKTAAEVLHKTDERKSIRRSTVRTSFRQNAYTEQERPLKPTERQQVEKLSETVADIRKHEDELVAAALRTSTDISAKTLPQIVEFIETNIEPTPRPQVSEALAAEYEEVLEELDGDTKTEVEKLLKENNLGKTPDNLRLAQFVLAQSETYEDLNGEAVKQIIQNSMLMEEFAEAAIPEKLQKFVKEQLESPKAATIQTILGQIKNELDTKHKNFERARTENYVEKLRQIAEVSPASLRWMEKNNIPLTLNNMQTMQSIVKNSFGLGRSLGSLKEKEEEREVSEESEEAELVDEVLDAIPDADLADLSSGKDSPESLLDELYRKLENLSEASGSREIIEQVKSIQSSLLIQKKSAGKTIPVNINGDLTDLKVYIINDITNKDEVKAFISLKTKSLGSLQINLNLQGGKTDVSMSSDKTDAAEFLSKNEGTLKSLLKEIGLEAGTVNYGTAKERNAFAEEVADDKNIETLGGYAFEVRA